MWVARIPLLLTATAGLHMCLTNPNPKVPDEERKKFTGSAGFKGNIITWYPNIVKYAQWVGIFCEVVVILASHFPNYPVTKNILSALVKKPASIHSIRVTPEFFAGIAMAATGSLVRHQCYRSLGKQFTYQLSFRKDHELVTHGPYSYVRHPSYTALIIAIIGVCTAWFSRGSWLMECGVLETQWGAWTVGTLFASALSLVGICLARPAREDRALRGQFGEEWDEWARRVPYRLFPYVY